MTASVVSKTSVVQRDKHVGLRRERMRGSPQAHEGRFRNPGGVQPDLKGLAPPLAAEFLFKGARRAPSAPLPVHDPRPLWLQPPETGLRVTWLGHSTMLLEVDGVRILTDPVFGDRASPVSFMGPKRFHPVPAPIADLPPIDVMLLSHDHYDHLCRSSVTELAHRPLTVVTALGVATHLEAYGMPAGRIHELDWHENLELPGVRFTATPAQHFSGRGLGDRNATLWASWVIETERHKLFFSGDTGLFDGFTAIGEQYGPFDLTMLEIGAYHPAWGTIHLGPENALTAHQRLQGRVLMPVHWGTFDLALHTWQQPAEDLFRLSQERDAKLLLPRLGWPLEPRRMPEPTPWWRDIG
jgi:L-ascorbate metabolism protein UlaG (beta-lactamase superfamily)